MGMSLNTYLREQQRRAHSRESDTSSSNDKIRMVSRSEISTAAAHLSLNRLARGSCSRRMKERKPSNTCEAGTSPGCTRAERKYTCVARDLGVISA